MARGPADRKGMPFVSPDSAVHAPIGNWGTFNWGKSTDDTDSMDSIAAVARKSGATMREGSGPGKSRRPGDSLRSLLCLLTALAMLVGASGCTRRWFRRQADKEVTAL